MSTAVTITVSLKDSTPKKPKLKLRDSEGNDPGDENLTTEVDPSATVTWVPDTASGINSLTGIRKKSKDAGEDLLAAPPVKEGNNYVGTIVANSPGKGKKEKYEIGFKIDGDSVEYWSDPVLQMKV